MFDLDEVTTFANKAIQSGARSTLYKFFLLEELGDNYLLLVERLHDYLTVRASYFYMSHGINGLSYSQVEGVPLNEDDYGFRFVIETLKACLTEQLISFEAAPFMQKTENFCSYEMNKNA